MLCPIWTSQIKHLNARLQVDNTSTLLISGRKSQLLPPDGNQSECATVSGKQPSSVSSNLDAADPPVAICFWWGFLPRGDPRCSRACCGLWCPRCGAALCRRLASHSRCILPLSLTLPSPLVSRPLFRRPLPSRPSATIRDTPSCFSALTRFFSVKWEHHVQSHTVGFVQGCKGVWKLLCYQDCDGWSGHCPRRPQPDLELTSDDDDDDVLRSHVPSLAFLAPPLVYMDNPYRSRLLWEAEMNIPVRWRGRYIACVRCAKARKYVARKAGGYPTTPANRCGPPSPAIFDHTHDFASLLALGALGSTSILTISATALQG